MMDDTMRDSYGGFHMKCQRASFLFVQLSTAIYTQRWCEYRSNRFIMSFVQIYICIVKARNASKFLKFKYKNLLFCIDFFFRKNVKKFIVRPHKFIIFYSCIQQQQKKGGGYTHIVSV